MRCMSVCVQGATTCVGCCASSNDWLSDPTGFGSPRDSFVTRCTSPASCINGRHAVFRESMPVCDPSVHRSRRNAIALAKSNSGGPTTNLMTIVHRRWQIAPVQKANRVGRSLQRTCKFHSVRPGPIRVVKQYASCAATRVAAPKARSISTARYQ